MSPSTPGRVLAALLALLLVPVATLLLSGAAGQPASLRISEQRVDGAGVSLDTTLYLPVTTPAPAVLVAHGFGGSKASVAADARVLAERGFVVLAWSARGFGASTGQIALNAPDAEVTDARALVDWLGARPEVVTDGPGDPRVGITGASYGGAVALLLAGYDSRVDAVVPVITWNDLGQALFPNAAAAGPLPLDTPARGAFAPDGVFKRGWAGVFFSAGRPGAGGATPGAGGLGAAEAADGSGTDGNGDPSAGDGGTGGSAVGSESGGDVAGAPAAPDGSPPAASDGAAAPGGIAAPSVAATPATPGTPPVAGTSGAPPVAGTPSGPVPPIAGGPATPGAPPVAGTPPGPGAPVAGTPVATGAPGSVAAPLTCGRFTPDACRAYTEAATTGQLSPTAAALLRRSSPATVTNRITAPTLLVQGEQDTLFGLDQADANARQIAAAGTLVKMTWFAGGHDGGAPNDAIRDQIGEWFDFHLAGTGDDPGTGFAYAVESGVRTQSDTPTGRTIEAPGYPGLAGLPAVGTQALPLEGAPQIATLPPGANPAAITSLPGLGGRLGNTGGRLAALTAELPGQSALFRTAPLDAPLLIAGAPRVDVTVARVPGQPGSGEAVLFGKVYEVSPDGLRTLLGSAVAPIRVAVPADGSPATISVTLPGVAAPIEAGNRLLVSFSTTDQGYAGPVQPAVWQIGLAGTSPALAAPVVPGQTVTANTVPLGPALGIAGVLGAALLAWAASRWFGRRRAAAPAADPTAPPLEIHNLAKTYQGGFSAVKDVSFTVERGMVLGLLGPNGAGKTTVLRMLMGLIRPTAGTIHAFGEPVTAGGPVLARIGAFVEGPGFLPHLSGADNLRLYWAATGRPTAEAHLDEALEIAGLGGSIQRRVGTYSQGMRQRLAIAQAMLGLPELLVLDEPTNGLDPPQIHAMREVLRAYAAGGRTVLVSSHQLAEVEQTCTHVVVMHHGLVVADGAVEDIIAGGGAASFAVDAPERAAAVLGGLAGVHAVEVEGPGTVHAELNGTPRAAAVRALVAAGIDVASAGPRRRLEDAFLALVGEDRSI